MGMTQQALIDKRKGVQAERQKLLRRLEEVDNVLVQLQHEEATCTAQERQLQTQMDGTTAHFEDMIAKIVHEQRELANEKSRAVCYKECGHTALEITRMETRRRGTEFARQLH